MASYIVISGGGKKQNLSTRKNIASAQSDVTLDLREKQSNIFLRVSQDQNA